MCVLAEAMQTHTIRAAGYQPAIVGDLAINPCNGDVYGVVFCVENADKKIRRGEKKYRNRFDQFLASSLST